MNLLKSLSCAAFAGVMLVAGSLGFASAAQAAYYGDWYYDNNTGGWDIMQLGDGDDRYLHLEGTEVACGPKGASYARMHQVLSDANDSSGNISWWVVKSCDNGNFYKVCVQNDYGDRACSAYEVVGWYNWRNHIGD